ncbi:NAD-dependent epimerase/dehydratase family protein [Mucilaginibacter gotjawali]|uniref:Nucleoside-diphosphate-sugar epimerase n=2 Tax=Mucilaginibacter gotjawali TaxID=1550579 RepID=A0A839S993_9SPHI|nr:NAD-dependent epimerase/dehydratase family protein [Mucilaginibacter gotjawali]MBB3053813.1 nucleoside-diphosphate-sugar epimerase [Mucilaginibacter gotjawali]BAU54076.1 putative epimerase/dehydratase [Mucilaginibacter gotjawali]
MEKKEISLVIGSNGQIGKVLTPELRKRYGEEAVLAADLAACNPEYLKSGPYFQLDVMEKLAIVDLVTRNKITTIYHLGEIPFAGGERSVGNTLNFNISGLVNVLDVAKIFSLKVFWPSSVDVFGPTSPKQSCPQHTIIEPATLYGITKVAGEHLCNYYYEQYGVDVRSLRFPGLISHTGKQGGRTTDYAIEMYYHALKNETYNCFLKKETTLPMMYMPDAIRAILELMDAMPEQVKIRTAYNVSAMSFSPDNLIAAITGYLPGFTVKFTPDYRQRLADRWPASIDHKEAVNDWGWQPKYDLKAMTEDVLYIIGQKNTYNK